MAIKFIKYLFIACISNSCLAEENPLVQAYLDNDYEAFASHYEKVIDKNETTLSGGSPFSFLIYSFLVDDPRFFNLVIQHADPNHSDRPGLTAIFEVVRKCDIERAKKLVEKGKKVNHRNTKGSTVLHWVAESKCYDLAKYLIESGGDAYTSDNDGITPLDIAKSKKDKHMIESMQNSKAALQ